jgi:hypothetical protein
MATIKRAKAMRDTLLNIVAEVHASCRTLDEQSFEAARIESMLLPRKTRLCAPGQAVAQFLEGCQTHLRDGKRLRQQAEFPRPDKAGGVESSTGQRSRLSIFPQATLACRAPNVSGIAYGPDPGLESALHLSVHAK